MTTTTGAALSAHAVAARRARVELLRAIREGDVAPAELLSMTPDDAVACRTRVYAVLVAAGWEKHVVIAAMDEHRIKLDAKVGEINRIRGRVLRCLEYLEQARRNVSGTWPRGPARV